MSSTLYHTVVAFILLNYPPCCQNDYRYNMYLMTMLPYNGNRWYSRTKSQSLLSHSLIYYFWQIGVFDIKREYWFFLSIIEVNEKPSLNALLLLLGPRCEININECASSPCLNGGRCYDEPAAYRCLCSPAYTGTHCETPSKCQWHIDGLKQKRRSFIINEMVLRPVLR